VLLTFVVCPGGDVSGDGAAGSCVLCNMRRGAPCVSGVFSAIV
jgi:hypothetical protein